MTRRTAPLLVALIGLGALAPLTSASPAGAAPPRTFTTNDESAAPDLAPGDGVCLTEADTCTLQAALDEAIALRRGTIVVDGFATATAAAVRGSITLRATDRSSGLYIDSLVVERGATLALESGILNEAALTVRGRMTIDRTVVIQPHRLRIDPSGSLALRSSLVVAEGAGFVNHGRLDVTYSTLRRTYETTSDLRIIQTAGAGATSLTASNLMGPRGHGRACSGTRPTSHGHNLAYDGTCRLTHPTDLGPYRPPPDELGAEGTPRLDAVPAGEAGCGTTTTLDQAGRPRPADGDGDGTAACDIGYHEVQEGEGEP